MKLDGNKKHGPCSELGLSLLNVCDISGLVGGVGSLNPIKDKQLGSSPTQEQRLSSCRD